MKRLGCAVSAAVLIGCAPDVAVDGTATATSAALTLEPAVVCGDGRRMNGEECDDGNIADGDGCSSACTLEGLLASGVEVPVCGDGQVGFSEECDDGNLVAIDGCSTTCEVEPGFTCTTLTIEGGIVVSSCTANPAGCGDGLRDAGEACDDGNLVLGDGCSTTCLVEDGFTCVGKTGGLSSCNGGGCGNGMLSLREGCDDGNATGGDGCSATCEVESGWTCAAVPIPCNVDGCTSHMISVCELSDGCGDRRRVSGEQCDDGNVSDGDGCSASCLLEQGFRCFDIFYIADGAPKYTRCEPEGCGDGAISGDEECDDWNLTSDDGCSSSCTHEPGFTCEVVGVMSLPETGGQRTVGCVSFACGDGSLDPGEECDDGADNDDYSPDACRADCTLPRCGDFIEDSGELCDDGSANGLPGFCSTTCNDLEPLIRLDEDPYQLHLVPGIIGLLPSETDLTPVCADEMVDLDDFAHVRDVLDGAGVVMGRLMRARADFLVDNPIVFLDDPGTRGDASVMFSLATAVEPAVGSYQVREGEQFVAPIAIGGSLSGCDCGSPRNDCVDFDGHHGTLPGCLEGTSCPNYQPELAIDLRFDPGSPDEHLGDPVGAVGSLFSCSQSCWFAGNTAICDGNPTSDIEPPVPDRCTVESPELPTGRLFAKDICPYVMSPVGNCSGACDDATGGCLWLEPRDTIRDDECGLSPKAGALVSTSLCTPDDLSCDCGNVDVPPDAIPEELTPPQVLAACYRGGSPPEPECVFPDSTTQAPEVSPLMCASDGAPRNECLYCPGSIGGCLPIEPRERATGEGLRTLAPTSLWTQVRPFEAKEGERYGRLSEAQLRAPGRFDPRRAHQMDDPVVSPSGELLIEATDVSFPGRGVPFEFVRTYRSGGQRSGSLGPGWTHNYEERIEVIGDPYNRLGAPTYCLSDLPTIRCLLHHDGHGGSQLFVFDPKTGVFVPNPGAFGVIRAELSDDVHKLMDIPTGVPRIVLTEPGGTTKTFDVSGVLLSVKDERGFGVELEWHLLDEVEVENNGAWSNVLPAGLLPPDPRSLQAAAAHADWLNRLNRLRLVGAQDSYGRYFKFEYERYFRDSDVGPSGPYRRSRLSAITYRGAPLVLYDHTEFSLTHDAYLTNVKRIGLYEELEPASPIVTSYEYQHDVFMKVGAAYGALFVDDPDAPTLASPTAFATRVLGDLKRFGDVLYGCTAGRELSFDPDTLRTDCGAPIVPIGAADAMGIATAPMFNVLREHIADNIVRVRRGGSSALDIELESFFDPDPTSPDFDRVVRQRYGAAPAPRAEPELVSPRGSEAEDVFVHRWFTRAPESSTAQVTGVDPNVVPPAQLTLIDVDSDGGPAENPELRSAWFDEGHRVPPEVLAAVPLVGHDRFQVDGRSDGLQTCERLDRAQLLPFFAAHEPVGARNDQLRTVVARTNASCQSLAARHARDAFLSDEVSFPDDPELDFDFVGVRRELYEADLALVCRWVQHTDRTGVMTTTGLNFIGLPLVEDAPSPAGTGRAITIRRFNADGLLVREVKPDGGRIELAWGALGDEDDLDFTAGAPLRRGLLRSMVEYPSSDPALEPALEELSSGELAPIPSRVWQYDYEPAFQKVAREVQPDLTVVEHYYDWQQQASRSQREPFVSRLLYRTGIHLWLTDFEGRDLDGDGTVGVETSAGLVLTVVRDVDLGDEVADVGIRRTLNDTGCVLAERRVKDADDPDHDFDFTTYRYYEDLEHAEAGDLDEDDDCHSPCGPLASSTRLRSPDSTAPSDQDSVFVAYDPLGGVRLSERNGDGETREVTIRNSVGQVVLEERPGGLEVQSTYDERGQLIAQRAIDVVPGSSMLPRVTRTAWGAQGVSLGSCIEIEDRACEHFDDFAIDVQRRHRDGDALPVPLDGASYVVPLFDREDREVGSVDAEGGLVTQVRNDAGAVVSEKVDATPPLVTRYRYDDMGRTLSVSRGEGGDALVTLAGYDQLSRLVAVQTHVAPGSDELRPGHGTIERFRYDRLDRQTSRLVEGDDGAHQRRLLAIERVERNRLGVERFTHRYAGALSSTERARPTGVHAGDDWVSTERRFDATLRPVLVAAEGLATPTEVEWDGLGVREVSGATATALVDIDPAARTRTITRRALSDGVAAQPAAVVEVARFDGRGLLVEERARDEDNGVERVTSHGYDALGQRLASVDPSGRGVRVMFDRAGRPESVTEHGPTGLTERETDAVFDQMGRVVIERPAIDAPSTDLIRDGAGRVLESSSGSGTGRFVDRMVFDSAGRLASKTAQGTRTRVTTFTYNDGATAPTTLDVDGRLAKSITRDGLERAVAATDFNVVSSRDARLVASRPALSTQRSFDSLGRIVGESTLGDFPSLSPTLSGQAAVQLGQLVPTYDDDVLGPKSLALQSGTDFSFGYSERGNLETLTRAGLQTISVALSYQGSLWVGASVDGVRDWRVQKKRDAFGFIVGSRLGPASGPTVSEDAVLRGPTGKVTAELRAGGRLGRRLKGFRYDGLARFSSQRFAEDPGITFAELLDETAAALHNEEAGAAVVQGVDNVFTASLTDADAVVASSEDQHRRSFRADVDATAAGVPPTLVNGRRVDRDDLQHIASDGTLDYVFDVFDRLVLVRRGPIEELRVAYDGMGRRRLERRRMLGGHVEDAVLEYVGGNVVEETEALTGAVLVATTHAPGLDAPLVVTIAGETTGPPANIGDATYVLRTNARGDAVAAVDDASGVLVEEQDLDPWGEREITTTPGRTCVEGAEGGDLSRRVSLPSAQCAPHARVLGRFGIAGGRSHSGTKLVDLRNRVYAPHLRGFLTKDPLGTVDSQGLHTYAAGDPINLRDPWGLGTKDKGVKQDCKPYGGGGAGSTVCKDVGGDGDSDGSAAATSEAREQQREDAAHERIAQQIAREQQRGGPEQNPRVQQGARDLAAELAKKGLGAAETFGAADLNGDGHHDRVERLVYNELLRLKLEGYSRFQATATAGNLAGAVLGEIIGGVTSAIFARVLLTGSRPAFTAAEHAAVAEAQSILRSTAFAEVRAAQAAGQSAEIAIAGRTIVVEPAAPLSGMTLFGEGGFVLGREAFTSEAELTKTVLHEVFRLRTSEVGATGVASQAAASAETEAAFSFAERAFDAFFR